MINQRGPTNLEHHVHMGDSSREKVDIMRTIKLKLATGYVLKLQKVFYIPSIRRNLSSISLLNSQGYRFFCLKIAKLKCIRMGKWLVLELYVAIYIDLIYLIMVLIVLLILLLLLLLLLNVQELMIIPQC